MVEKTGYVRQFLGPSVSSRWSRDNLESRNSSHRCSVDMIVDSRILESSMRTVSHLVARPWRPERFLARVGSAMDAHWIGKIQADGSFEISDSFPIVRRKSVQEERAG